MAVERGVVGVWLAQSRLAQRGGDAGTHVLLCPWASDARIKNGQCKRLAAQTRRVWQGGPPAYYHYHDSAVGVGIHLPMTLCARGPVPWSETRNGWAASRNGDREEQSDPTLPLGHGRRAAETDEATACSLAARSLPRTCQCAYLDACVRMCVRAAKYVRRKVGRWVHTVHARHCEAFRAELEQLTGWPGWTAARGKACMRGRVPS